MVLHTQLLAVMHHKAGLPEEEEEDEEDEDPSMQRGPIALLLPENPLGECKHRPILRGKPQNTRQNQI